MGRPVGASGDFAGRMPDVQPHAGAPCLLFIAHGGMHYYGAPAQPGPFSASGEIDASDVRMPTGPADGGHAFGVDSIAVGVGAGDGAGSGAGNPTGGAGRTRRAARRASGGTDCTRLGSGGRGGSADDVVVEALIESPRPWRSWLG